MPPPPRRVLQAVLPWPRRSSCRVDLALEARRERLLAIPVVLVVSVPLGGLAFRHLAHLANLLAYHFSVLPFQHQNSSPGSGLSGLKGHWVIRLANQKVRLEDRPASPRALMEDHLASPRVLMEDHLASRMLSRPCQKQMLLQTSLPQQQGHRLVLRRRFRRAS